MCLQVRRAKKAISAAIGLLLLLMGTKAVVNAQIKLEITEPGGGRGFPIAIPVLQRQSGEEQRLAEEFADILARDLDLSGYFHVIDRANYGNDNGGLLPENIDFRAWSSVGALALVKGGLWVEGESITIEVRLFDVAQSKQLGGKRYRGERKDFRRMAHRFADQVMLLLTGELGPFDSRIAFVSNRGGGRAKEIYVTDLTGTRVTAVTRDRSLNLSPSWDPSAEVLSFCSYRTGGPYPYRVNIESGTPSRLYPMVGYSGGRWSPDGSRIAVSLDQDGNSDLFLLSTEGRLIRRLTDHAGIDVSPTWSPNGRELAFCSDRGGGPQIYVMDVGNGKVQRLTFRGNYNTSPAWSPKGDRIAYVSRAGGFRVMTIARDGGEPREVASGEDPSWSPDGRYLVFSSRGRLRIASRDGKSIKQLTGGGGDDTSPAWSPRLR